MLNEQQEDLLEEITTPHPLQPSNPKCVHPVDQQLVDNLCAIIRELWDGIELLQK